VIALARRRSRLRLSAKFGLQFSCLGLKARAPRSRFDQKRVGMTTGRSGSTPPPPAPAGAFSDLEPLSEMEFRTPIDCQHELFAKPLMSAAKQIRNGI